MGRFFVGARWGIVRGGGASVCFDRVGRDLEVAGAWLVWLMIGAFVVQLLLGAENRATRDAWRDERVALTLRQLADRFENDLALGLNPVGNGHGARLIDAAYGRDPALYAVLVVDRRGTVVLDSDRGGIGERVPAAMRRAARAAGGAPWRARLDAAPLLQTGAPAGLEAGLQTGLQAELETGLQAGARRAHGVAIHNAFGERVADVILLYPDAWPADTGVALSGHAAWIAAATTFVLASAFAAALLAQWRGTGAVRAVAREQAAGRRVARARLAALDRCREAEEGAAPRKDAP